MPVILNPEVYQKWLDVQIQDPKKLELILEDSIIHEMKYYPVSTFVNDVKNNDPNCIKPIKLGTSSRDRTTKQKRRPFRIAPAKVMKIG